MTEQEQSFTQHLNSWWVKKKKPPPSEATGSSYQRVIVLHCIFHEAVAHLGAG